MQGLIEKKQKLLKQLAEYGSFTKGSISSVCSNCNRAKCICRSKLEKKAFRLTYKDKNQKTVIVYVKRERLPEIKKMINNHVKIKKILEQLIDVNIKIFKNSD